MEIVRKKILFICGSINQTTQMHQIARELAEYDCWFTPYYTDGWVEALMRKPGLLDWTIAGGKLSKRCTDYLDKHGLRVDYQGQQGGYDLTLTCSDLFFPKNVRNTPSLLVQEGILDPEMPILHFLAAKLRVLPLWLAGTGASGLSGLYDRFCVASPGYRDHFIAGGAPADRVMVTGMPNFDNCRKYYDNNFPYKGFVLICTSDSRETFKLENRRKFLRKCRDLADGRQMIFKLHPNEKVARAKREIAEECPGALVYTDGSAEQMIANSDVLITQYSSVVYVGQALGKEIHTYFDKDELRRLAPLQIEHGSAARNISYVCRELLGDMDAADVRERILASMKRPGSGSMPAVAAGEKRNVA